MKSLILIIPVLMFSAQAFAKGERVVAEISFKNSSKDHKYILFERGEKPSFNLVFEESRKKPVEKLISKIQAEFIKNEATRIIWNSEYRKPANAQGCTEYVSISSGTESTKVCAENRKATGMTYGLLNSMSQVFGVK